MEVKYEERSFNFENITVNYEFDERQPDDEDVHFSKFGGALEESQEVVAFGKSEVNSGETINEHQFITIISEYDSGYHDNLEKRDVKFRDTLVVEQSLEEARSVLTSEKKVNEDVFTLVSNNESEEIKISSVLSQETIVTGHSTDGEIIEVDDSSQEEILDPLITSEYRPEEPNYARFESKHEENSSFLNGNQQPSSSSTLTSIDKLDHAFIAFENALDDWYSKISVHGPLKDCEIMESAQQLAQHFNFEFPDDAEWLAMFKYRHYNNTTLKKNRVFKKDGQYDEGTGNSIGKRRRNNNDKRPSSKKRKGNGRTFEHPTESPDYSLTLMRAKNPSERSGWSGGELYVTESPAKSEGTKTVNGPKKVGQTMETTAKECHSFFEVIDTDVEVGQTMETTAKECHSFFEVIDTDDEVGQTMETTAKACHSFFEVVDTDDEVGQTMETTSEECHSFFEVNGTENEEPAGDTTLQFETLILEWYFSITAKPKIMVAASIFEIKAVEIAQSLKLVDFRPSKMWLKRFLGRHGMWCVLGEKRVLICEPEAGLLKYRFDIEFEAWYYFFPTPPDNFLLDSEIAYNNKEHITKKVNKLYLAAVLDWYVTQPSSVSATEILTVEAKIAETVGFSDSQCRSIEEFYRNWCLRHENFYESIDEAYSLCSPILLPSVLKNVSVRCARKFALAGFTCQPMWMKRYLQLNGLIYREEEVVNCYMFDPTSCRYELFERIFRIWQVCSVKTTRWLREALDELVPEKVPQNDPLRMVIDLTIEPDPPLKIAHSFTLRK